MGIVFFISVLGKLVLGILSNPLTINTFWILGIAMSTWGEFAFIILVDIKSNNMITDDQYAAIILAILMSMILSPYLLQYAIQSNTNQLQYEVNDIIHIQNNHNHYVYYKIYTSIQNIWGLQMSLMQHFQALQLQCIEFRCEICENNLVTYEAYLKDLYYYDHNIIHYDYETITFTERLAFLRNEIYDYLQHYDTNIIQECDNIEFNDLHGFSLIRWLPGKTNEERIEYSLCDTKAQQKMIEEGFSFVTNISSPTKNRLLKLNDVYVIKGYTSDRKKSVHYHKDNEEIKGTDDQRIKH
jgi:hypothetical protein